MIELSGELSNMVTKQLQIFNYHGKNQWQYSRKFTFCEIRKHMFDSLIEGSGFSRPFKSKTKSFVICPPVVKFRIHHCVLNVFFYRTTKQFLQREEK